MMGMGVENGRMHAYTGEFLVESVHPVISRGRKGMVTSQSAEI